MRNLLILLLPILAALLAAVDCDAGARDPKPAWDQKSFAVHEWGTFTAVQGSNGVVLDGLMHEERDLPSFVYDLRDSTGVTGYSPKMETPVIYFYSPTARRVHVDVKFPRGAITQWYPAAHRVNHQRCNESNRPLPADGRVIGDLRNGFITWGKSQQLQVLAPGVEARLPHVEQGDPWIFARDVDANALRTFNYTAAQVEGVRAPKTEEEMFLFYRGLGAFRMPLVGKVRSERAGQDRYRADVQLETKEPVTHVFLIWVRDGKSGYRYLPTLEGSQRVELDLDLRASELSTKDLVGALAHELSKTGLYYKEALAMARTWQQGYFQDEGLRVLYVLPRKFVDAELPLVVREVGKKEPVPVVRTFVGRLELLSPERERVMVRAVRDYASGGPEARGRARSVITEWGRFAIPYLNRVQALTDDATVKSEVNDLLDSLKLRR